MLTRDQIAEAWSMMGATAAGRNARQLLVDELMSLCPQPGNPSALARHEGRRSLARELLELLDKQAEHGRPDQPDSPSPARRSAVEVGRARSLRRVEFDADAERKRVEQYERERSGG